MTKWQGYKIDRDIPAPNSEKKIPRIMRIRKSLAWMNVGDSFLIPRRDWKNTTNPNNLIPRKEAWNEFGIKVTGKLDKGGYRIWRVK